MRAADPIRVPAATVDELRLEFASGGLPSSGRIGFEIFDRTAFGATEFLEQVNYRRALEGEIARTIATIGEVVERARAHRHGAELALRVERAAGQGVGRPQAARQPPAATATVQGIAESRRGQRRGSPAGSGRHPRQLRPAARASGRRGRRADGRRQMERQQRIERDLTTRSSSLLEPVVGAERVRVNVVGPARSLRAKKRQKRSGIRRRRSFAASRRRATRPRPARPARRAWPVPRRICRRLCRRRHDRRRRRNRPQRLRRRRRRSVVARGSETTNYEISKIIRHTIRPRGEVARLSVAVILDDEAVAAKNPDGTTSRSTHARKPEELQKIQRSSRPPSASTPTRGDQLTVENMPFEEAPVEEPTKRHAVAAYGATGLGRRPHSGRRGSRRARVLHVRAARDAAVATATVTGVADGRRSALTAAARQAACERSRDLEGEIEAQLDAAATEKSAEHVKLPVLTRRLGALARKGTRERGSPAAHVAVAGEALIDGRHRAAHRR